MQVTTERHEGVLVARVSGRIEARDAGALEKAITGALRNGDRAVVLDFEELAYIGNVGVRALRITARVLRDRGAAVAVCSPQGRRRRGLRRKRCGRAHQGPSEQGRRARVLQVLTRRAGGRTSREFQRL